MPRVNPPKDKITIHCYDGRRHSKRKVRQVREDTRWMEIILYIAVTLSQGADVKVRMWPPFLRQTLKSGFENGSNRANALTNLSEK